jgi:hypothetical protein
LFHNRGWFIGTGIATDTNVTRSQRSLFSPNMGWTKDLPRSKVLNCVAVADETFMQADRKLSLVERTGLDLCSVEN